MADNTDFNDFSAEAKVTTQIDGSTPAGGGNEQPRPGNGAAPGDEEAPRPLQRDLPPATPFPADALASLLGGAALKMHEVIQAPLGICGNSVLSAAALAVQAHADVVIDGRVFPVSEMFLTIGLTGERKSACDRAALWPHRKHERALCAKYKLDRLDYECRHIAFEKAKAECLASKQNRSYDAKQAALRELGPAPLAPLDPMLLCEEPTYEGLVKLLAVGQPSVGLFTDEGGRFIGGYGMSSDNMLKTAAGLSVLWDGKAIDRVRVVGRVRLRGTPSASGKLDCAWDPDVPRYNHAMNRRSTIR
jgi:hypothetical protein